MSDFHRGTRRFDDVEAASFSPDNTDLTVTEDGGDWVAKDDVGNVVLRYDEGSGSWVMDSLKAGVATIGGVAEDRPLEEVGRFVDDSPNLNISVSGFDFYILEYYLEQGITNQDFTLRLNGDGSGTGDYTYQFEDQQLVTGADGINIWGGSDTFRDGSGIIYVVDMRTRTSIRHEGGIGNDNTNLMESGYREVDEITSQIDLLWEDTTVLELTVYGGDF